MIKKLVLMLLLSLLIVDIAYAQENISDWIYNTGVVNYNVEISSSLTPFNSPEDVSAEIFIVPKNNYMQEVKNIETNPDAEISSDKIVFEWDGVVREKKDFRVDVNVETNNNFPKIPKKINYPLEVDENLEYLQSTDSVDVSNEDMLKIVSELTKGEDDTLVVAHKLAEWVESNIEYSLSTMTKEASLNSTWVLENRRGVCDELTNLYIAMARASGIPARFVKGVSYTNSPQFEGDWGGHGWAEIYIPEYGWIPVDVTYGQFGRLDLGHIALKTDEDAVGSDVHYVWKGDANKRIDSSELKLSASSISHSGEYQRLVDFKVSPLRTQLGFGSYDVIELEIENLKDYYVSETFNIVVPENTIKIEGSKKKWILLSPKEKIKVHWLIKASEDLKRGYIYTSPVKVYTLQEVEESSIKLVENDKVYSLREMQDYIESSEEETSTGNVNVDCSPEKSNIRENEEITINCEVENKENQKLLDLEVCFDNKCQDTFLDIDEKKTFSDKIIGRVEGVQNVRVLVRNKDVNVLKAVPIIVESAPSIKMNIETPSEMEYYDEAEITFEVTERRGNLKEGNFEILLNGENIGYENLNEKTRSYSFTIEGKYLKSGENTIGYRIILKDDGKEVIEEGNEKINLINVTFWQRVKIFFRSIV